MRIPPVTTVAVLVLLVTCFPRPGVSQAVTTNAAALSAGFVRGFPGRTVNVPLSLRHTGTVSGVQFDLSYPPNKLSAGVLQAGVLSSNTVVRWREIVPGLHRV